MMITQGISGFEIPSRHRHLVRVSLRYARWISPALISPITSPLGYRPLIYHPLGRGPIYSTFLESLCKLAFSTVRQVPSPLQVQNEPLPQRPLTILSRDRFS